MNINDRLYLYGISALICISLFIALMCGCYKEPSVEGFYYVKAERPVDIMYTNQLGQTEVIRTDEFDYPLEFDSKDNYFHYKIVVTSDSGAQNIFIKIFFDDDKSFNDYERDYLNEDSIEYESGYCTPWSKTCARVTINF